MHLKQAEPARPAISTDPRDYETRFSPQLHNQTGNGWYRVHAPRSTMRKLLDFIGDWLA